MRETFFANFGKIILIIAGIIFLIFIVKYFEKIKKFILEVKVELTKVSWSTRQELLSATWIVILTTGALGIFIGVVDFVLSKFLSLLIK